MSLPQFKRRVWTHLKHLFQLKHLNLALSQFVPLICTLKMVRWGASHILCTVTKLSAQVCTQCWGSYIPYTINITSSIEESGHRKEVPSPTEGTLSHFWGYIWISMLYRQALLQFMWGLCSRSPHASTRPHSGAEHCTHMRNCACL